MRRLPWFAAALVLAVAAAGAEETVRPTPAEGAPPAATATPPAADAAAAPAPLVWHEDPARALAEAAETKRRIVVVVLQNAYPSPPCDRLGAAVGEPAARTVLEGLVRLRVVEGREPAWSRARGLEDLGHPYTALLDASGGVLATMRGAWTAADWAARVTGLAAAADRWETARATVAANPGDAAALWALSEALRDLGRTGEADDALSRGEAVLDDADRALVARYAFRRAEARFEDRVAVQDFEGAGGVLDAFERDHPAAPHRRWVALYRAVVRAHTGDLDVAIEEFDSLVAAAEGDPALRREAQAKAAAARNLRDRRKSGS